ncbi:MAG: arginase family protein [Vicinamibacterales bacterium]
MTRPIAIVGASSSIGIRPYDDGEMRQLSRAPDVLRERGLIRRLDAIDLGDVVPPPYRDYLRPPRRARNEEEVVVYSRSLAQRVAAATAHERFALVLGGDCSIVLGCLVGAKRTARGQVGLVYVDAHADFATPEESRTGSVASMCLACASGRGETPLARLSGRAPLVEGKHIVLVGRRDAAQPWYGHKALSASAILDFPDSELLTQEFDEVASASLRRVAAEDLEGFWIQLDADVLNPAVMSAVDSPEPGGLMPSELVQFLTPLVRHPLALGLSLTTYDPALDADRSGARLLVRLLEALLVASRAVAQPA